MEVLLVIILEKRIMLLVFCLGIFIGYEMEDYFFMILNIITLIYMLRQGLFVEKMKS